MQYFQVEIDEILNLILYNVNCHPITNKLNQFNLKKCFTEIFTFNVVINVLGVMSIATKVAIQLNCKIGGAPWTVVLPLSGLMVVGYDVTRDTANKVTFRLFNYIYFVFLAAVRFSTGIIV